MVGTEGLEWYAELVHTVLSVFLIKPSLWLIGSKLLKNNFQYFINLDTFCNVALSHVLFRYFIFVVVYYSTLGKSATKLRKQYLFFDSLQLFKTAKTLRME